MNAQIPRIALLLVVVMGIVAAARVAAWPLAPITLAKATRPVNQSPPRSATSLIGHDSVSTIVSRNAFRIARRPVLPAYDPLRLAELSAPPAPRPALILVGVVTGGTPSAVVEGLPGADGARVLRVGDVVAGLRVKRIDGGRVVIAGTDTTWVLEVREPWKN